MSQFEAINTAKLKAVDAILFKGISMGNAGCPSNPIINDVTLKVREKAFFNNFFEKNGAYNQFVTLSGDGSIQPNDRVKVAGKMKIGVYVVVNHRGLKAYMEKNGTC
ncbi:MAG: hypothetical protein IPO23_13380 [Flavobacterium sp.]|nr:hypothetical protein [Flavobacterium sp.]